jgi:hypothetical protein
MVTPSDSVVGPIVAELAAIAQQIEGIGTCYTTAPDGAPEDNSVMLPCKSWSVESMTNGRLRLRLTFQVIHCFLRRQLSENLTDIQTYIPAWWTVLSDWNNQTLNGKAASLDITEGQIAEVVHAGVKFLGLIHTVTVLTEFRVRTAANA